MFDLSLPKLLILAVLALVVFGPNELPALAARAGRALRELRRIAEGAQADLREGLGPEFSDFSIDDLHPKRFVHKHLLSDLNGAATAGAGPAPETVPVIAGDAPASRETPLTGEAPFILGGDAPVDAEAT